MRQSAALRPVLIAASGALAAGWLVACGDDEAATTDTTTTETTQTTQTTDGETTIEVPSPDVNVPDVEVPSPDINVPDVEVTPNP